MDVAELSLWISGASFAVASASAAFAWRQARAAEAQLKRKEPVFEFTIHQTARDDGWAEGSFTARNSECVRLDWIAIEFKQRNVKVISREDAFGDDGLQAYTVLHSPLPLDKATRRIQVDGRLSANKSAGGPSGVYNVKFAFHGPLRAKGVKHIWKWADE